VLVINAGGESRRMGSPKALLPVPPDGMPLLAHIIRRVEPLHATRILVVSNDAALGEQVDLPTGATVVADGWPGTGTLGGIATALSSLRPDEEWALVLACDLPLVRHELCGLLLEIAAGEEESGGGWACIMPVVGGYEEPLHALYHRSCLPAIVARLERGERRVISFLPDVRTRRVEEAELRTVDPALRSFVNANTPEEWQAALALLAAERQG
jgi:molybdopterin-guanine dinucleotide biosynthesis protein A